MNDQEFIHQLASELSAFRPTVTWTLEPVWYRKTAGTQISGRCRGGSVYCGAVVVLGRSLSIQVGPDAYAITEYLIAEGYEVVEAFDNGTMVK